MQILKRWLPLFLISSLSLFLELAVVRWLSAEVRLMAYYKNLILLAAFLGLAVGFAVVGKDLRLERRFPWLWVMFSLLVIVIGYGTQQRPLIYPGVEDQLLWKTAITSFWIALIGFIGIVLLLFLLSMFLFIPVGQMVGKEMAHHPPVKAYIVNILASLAGVWGFSLVSFWRTPPVIWFGIALLGIGIYTTYVRKMNRLAWVAYILTLAAIGIFDQGTLWSPYNRLNLEPVYYLRQSDGQKVTMGYVLNVQHSFYQSGMDLSPASIDAFRLEGNAEGAAELDAVAFANTLPYRLVPAQSRVLVVGAGMGNDAAAALRYDMGEIDAVDIDPVILDLGIQFHPEQPYNDPRVNVIEADARAYFSQTEKKYDLVVFGALDSHTLLSGFSSVRLDSYVYTLESLAQAKSLLLPNGYVSLNFVANEWIEERLGRMMQLVYGAENVYIYKTPYSGTSFVAGGLTPKLQEQLALQSWTPNPDFDDLQLTTDDWPYLYLRARNIPAGNWQALLVIALVSLALIGRSFPGALRPEWHFWLLGAAFLLIEFKTITELALLFGTTWFVNSLAISGVLVMALAANLFVLSRKFVDLRWVYALLFASIILGYLVPLDVFAGLPGALKAVFSTAMLTVPLLFAGVIFSESLRRAGETARPLASNFSGSVVGGLLEYGTSLWGVKSMYLVAGLLYIGACVAAFRPNKKVT